MANMDMMAMMSQMLTQMNQMQQQSRGSSSGTGFNSGASLKLAGGGRNSVLVRGYDYGTTNEQIANHMAGVGAVQDVQMVEQGSVCITYGSAREAQMAAQFLNGTSIAGNSRYLDVVVMDPQEFLAGHNVQEERIQQFLSLAPHHQQAVMAKGSLASARDPTAVLVQRMNQATGNVRPIMNSAASSGSLNAQEFLAGYNIEENRIQQFMSLAPHHQQAVMEKGSLATARDPTAVLVQRMNQATGNVRPGKGNAAGLSSLDGKRCVLVRGYDYGTTSEQIMIHMSGAGTVQDVKAVDQGSVCVTYTFAEEATLAQQTLNGTSIDGNSRYIDVCVMDPAQFLSGHDIAEENAQQFYSLTPQQQMAVISKGTLASARNANAVLVQRMNQATGSTGGAARPNLLAMSGSFGGKLTVLVRGADYGTTNEQIASHMSSAGTITDVKTIEQGSVCVTYSSEEEAVHAAQSLNGTNIAGNSRYLDVVVMDPMQFLSGHNIQEERVQQFMNLTSQQQQLVMAKGSLASARDPTAVLVQRMNNVKAPGKGNSGGAGSNLLGIGGSVSVGGKCSVLVRGFDFGTSDEQIASHMSSIGPVQDCKAVDKGSVCVTYTTADQATLAALTLNGTNIAGQSRYLDVCVLDPMQFLAGHNIEMDKVQQFLALPPQLQTAVMVKGTLASARDPTAVLVQRMKLAKGAGKGSFGPAGGCGGGSSNGPYGGCGGDGGGMNANEMMMKMMQMMLEASMGQA